MDDFRKAWTLELDRLELDVDRAERMLASAQAEELPEWSEPTMRAPLPEDLVPRARLILERQLAVAHLLTQKAAASGRQLQVTAKLRGTAAPDVPVYVDVTA